MVRNSHSYKEQNLIDLCKNKSIGYTMMKSYGGYNIKLEYKGFYKKIKEVEINDALDEAFRWIDIKLIKY